MGPVGPHPGWLPDPPGPPPGRGAADVLASLSTGQLEERLAGFEQMLAQLPADDEVMRPSVEMTRDIVAAELSGRGAGR